MKQYTFNLLIERLAPWLDCDSINSFSLDDDGGLTFSFNDELNKTADVSVSYGDRAARMCRDLAAQGIPMRGCGQSPPGSTN